MNVKECWQWILWAFLCGKVSIFKRLSQSDLRSEAGNEGSGLQRQQHTIRLPGWSHLRAALRSDLWLLLWVEVCLCILGTDLWSGRNSDLLGLAKGVKGEVIGDCMLEIQGWRSIELRSELCPLGCRILPNLWWATALHTVTVRQKDTLFQF